MKKHSGMRPLDIVILLKIATYPYNERQNIRHMDLAQSLLISQGEVAESLHRSDFAGIYSKSSKEIFVYSFLDFLFFGMKYVFPVKPGRLAAGIPTSHSAYPLNEKIWSDKDIYIWECIEGTTIGQVIEPFYKKQPTAAFNDKALYELLILCDALRVGAPREIKLAKELLTQKIN